MVEIKRESRIKRISVEKENALKMRLLERYEKIKKSMTRSGRSEYRQKKESEGQRVKRHE